MSDQLPLPITLEDMVAEIDEELRHRAYVFPRRMQGAGLALRNRLQHRLDVMRAIKAHLEAERERVQAILNPTQTEGDAT